MVYRAQDMSEMCMRCGFGAEWVCRRCSRHYCAAHAPNGRRRCDPCETEYLAAETASVHRVTFVALVTSGLICLVGAWATHAARNGYIPPPYAHYAPLLLFGGLTSLTATFALPPIIRWQMRRRFLGAAHASAEKPRKRRS